VDEECRWSSVLDERTTNGADALAAPTWRDADDDERCRLHHGDEPILGGVSKERFGPDSHKALYRQRRIRQKPACVAPIASRIGSGTDKPQRRLRPQCQPGSELECRPVVLAAPKRHEYAVAARGVDVPREQSDIRWRCVENLGELVGKSVFDLREPQKDELDVVGPREPHRVSSEAVDGEHRTAGVRRQ